MTKRLRVGSKIRLTNTNYENDDVGKVFKVVSIARSTKDHPLYDEGVNEPGEHMALVTCEGLNYCLYEWEFEIE